MGGTLYGRIKKVDCGPGMKTSWLSIPKSNLRSNVRLFCFPYSGASASIYYSWSAMLPESIEVCPVQYPGHGTRVGEALITEISDLVDGLSEALIPFWDKPFAFFGHSMGALVSFELARRLRVQNTFKPIYLFVSGHNAPHLPDNQEPLHKLPEVQFIERLRKLNGTPDDVLENQELRDLVLPILRADFQVSETYEFVPGPPFETPICACGGLEDPYTSREGLEAWKEHTLGSASARMFPGDHFYLNGSKIMLLQVIARELSRVLTI